MPLPTSLGDLGYIIGGLAYDPLILACVSISDPAAAPFSDASTAA